MKERPILFATPMVTAVLEGRKTMTRRVIKLQPPVGAWPIYDSLDRYGGEGWAFQYAKEIAPGIIHNAISPLPSKGECPYGNPGDILWVRETWAKISDWTEVDPDVGMNDGYIYKADWGCTEHPKWRPSIFMPKEAARIFLRITNVRVERLQDITRKDCGAEGFPLTQSDCDYRMYRFIEKTDEIVPNSFIELWDSLNAKRGFGWETNPWVWVISFMRTEVDA